MSTENISFLYEKICCVFTLEVPLRGTSNEYPQHIAMREIRKISVLSGYKISGAMHIFI